MKKWESVWGNIHLSLNNIYLDTQNSFLILNLQKRIQCITVLLAMEHVSNGKERVEPVLCWPTYFKFMYLRDFEL